MALLGTTRDEEVARCLGRPLSGVMQRRQDKHIPLAVPRFRLWTRTEEALLGKLPDEKVEKRLNRPIKSVQARRLQFRKRPFGARPLRPWTRVSQGAVRNTCRFMGLP